jgi:hypothetical protein
LHISHLFARLASGDAPACNFIIVNGHDYTKGYYLADDIYGSWSTFVKTIPTPKSKKAAEFAKIEDACRKDTGRASDILQARFTIIVVLLLFRDKKTLDGGICDSPQHNHRA